jgi:hypothetical protein
VILEQFNLLPGQQIGLQRLSVTAHDLGLRRPEGFHHSRGTAELAAVWVPDHLQNRVVLYEPVAADYAAVAASARVLRVVFTWWDDLGRVNNARERAGLRPFKREFPVRGKAPSSPARPRNGDPK